MKLAASAALLAYATSAMGWAITMYKDYDCNDKEGDLEYMVLEGSGLLPYCIGPGGDHFPPGVTCTYFNTATASHDDCKEQIKSFNSFVALDGSFMMWRNYKDWSGAAVETRCGGQYSFADNGEISVFKSENACQNSWYRKQEDLWGFINYKGDRINAPIQGLSAWDA